LNWDNPNTWKQDWKVFSETNRELIPRMYNGAGRLNYMSVIGNHDNVLWDNFDSIPVDEKWPIFKSNQSFYWREGGIFFLFLNITSSDNWPNTEWYEGKRQTWEDLASFAQAELSSPDAQGADFRVVAFHVLAYYSQGWNPKLKEHLVPVFEQNQVDIVLSGHKHNYFQKNLDGIEYIVSGGGGGGHQSGGVLPPGSWAHAEYHHFVQFKRQQGSLKVEIIQLIEDWDAADEVWRVRENLYEDLLIPAKTPPGLRRGENRYLLEGLRANY
jgi:hypothetical protein